MQKKLFVGIVGLLLVLSLLPGLHADSGSSNDDQATDDHPSEDDLNDLPDDSDGRVIDPTRGPRPDMKPLAGPKPFEAARSDLRVRMNAKVNATLNGTRPLADLKERMHERKDQLKEELKMRKEAFKDDQRAFIEGIKQNITMHKERLEQLKQGYDDEKDAYLASRASVKERCEKNTSDDCKQIRREMNANAKQFMGNAAEQMQSIIASTSARVEASTYLDEDAAAEVIAKLEAHSDAIKAAQQKVDSLANSSDVNATKAAADELRTAWVEARVTVKLANGLLGLSQFEGFSQRLDHMSTRFTELSEKLAAEGKDVTTLNADIAKFNAKVDAAKSSYASVETSYVSSMDSVASDQEAEALIRSSKDEMKVIQDDLKGAREDLQAVLKDIKALSADALAQLATSVAAEVSA